jgi:hypothetical protein
LILTNALLKAANESLREHGRPNGILLIFDNLDRYTPEQVDQLLIRGSSLIKKLAAHAIYTVPIGLAYDPVGGKIEDEYAVECVLPMIALRQRGHLWQPTVADSPYNEAAVSEMVSALERRIVLERIFENVKDAHLLAKMSGGCLRDLLHLVTLAYSEEPTAQRISETAVSRAIRKFRTSFVRRLTPEDYGRLAQVSRHEQNPDRLTRQLLYRRDALEYLENGNVWMDVHPIIIEIEAFQHALHP